MIIMMTEDRMKGMTKRLRGVLRGTRRRAQALGLLRARGPPLRFQRLVHLPPSRSRCAVQPARPRALRRGLRRPRRIPDGRVTRRRAGRGSPRTAGPCEPDRVVGPEALGGAGLESGRRQRPALARPDHQNRQERFSMVADSTHQPRRRAKPAGPKLPPNDNAPIGNESSKSAGYWSHHGRSRRSDRSLRPSRYQSSPTSPSHRRPYPSRTSLAPSRYHLPTSCSHEVTTSRTDERPISSYGLTAAALRSPASASR